MPRRPLPFYEVACKRFCNYLVCNCMSRSSSSSEFKRCRKGLSGRNSSSNASALVKVSLVTSPLNNCRQLRETSCSVSTISPSLGVDGHILSRLNLIVADSTPLTRPDLTFTEGWGWYSFIIPLLGTEAIPPKGGTTNQRRLLPTSITFKGLCI
jgi:hypothetical protein